VIIFVPGYDSATRANLAVAEQILPADCQPLLGDLATRLSLFEALGASQSPLFAMTHGRRDALLAQGGEAAFGRQDLTRLAGRAVFAFACHTAGGLGAAAAGDGSVWWGYTGLVSAPPESTPALLPLFAGIFGYICEAFALGGSSEERRSVVLKIAEMCHEGAQHVDDLIETGAGVDAVSAYYSLLHIWDRLRVWEPGQTVPMMHPLAAPPALLL
jgi:hypothetical protein